jgi:hypothetical protein
MLKIEERRNNFAKLCSKHGAELRFKIMLIYHSVKLH